MPVPISDSDRAAALQRAREVYAKTQCATGCCGDLDGALASLERDLTSSDTRPYESDLLASVRAGVCDCGAQLGDAVGGRRGCSECGSWFETREHDNGNTAPSLSSDGGGPDV